ncbi:MAG: alpha/beta hydrolase [Gammaproteobacteria bacterium]
MTVNFDLQRRVATLGLLALAATRPAHSAEGTLERLPTLGAPGIAPRNVDVWLPPEFDRRRRYATLYMHDGQMLFDARQTWNGKAWHVDRVAAQLIANKVLQDFIVVAIANDPQRRHAEYFPQQALAHLQPPALRRRFIDEALGGTPAGDAYTRFVAEVVKPAVDARYPTLNARAATFIIGSSMGGLASLQALCEYPKIFGAAACLSTHWIGSFERNEAIPRSLREYLERKLPPPDTVRIYLDRGTEELDALYDDAQREMDLLMQRAGFTPPRFQSRTYPGAGHDEKTWRERVAEPLQFLLAR